MKSVADRAVVVEADPVIREQVVTALSQAGYEVFTEERDGMTAVLVFAPDVLILGADPPELDCCNLLSQLKASESTRNIRVLLLCHGAAAERSRGLDLGADDALSLPFDPAELLARVRAQLRDKRPHDELLEKMRQAEEHQTSARQIVNVVSEEKRTLRKGVLVVSLVSIAAAIVLFFFYLRSQRETRRVYAAVSKLQTGMVGEQELIERSRKMREELEHTALAKGEPERRELQQRTQQLRKQLASTDSTDMEALSRQLREADERLQRLESESRIAQDIIRSYTGSVCLLHVQVAFREPTSGRYLHYAQLTPQGEPVTDNKAHPLLSLDGSGPEVHIHGFGTGFLAGSRGQILTNHHVVEPWWQDDGIAEILNQGFEPVIMEMSAYFPGFLREIRVRTEKISSEADLAVVKGEIQGVNLKQLALDRGPGAAVSGEPVVLIGYPTGLDGILARAGEDQVRSIATASKGDIKQLMGEIARRRLIRPTNTQGHIGDVLADKIVYDAQTTSGGSGGPLFNQEGKELVRELGFRKGWWLKPNKEARFPSAPVQRPTFQHHFDVPVSLEPSFSVLGYP